MKYQIFHVLDAKCNCGKLPKSRNRIWGGSKAKISEFPWVVTIIIDDKEELCGGSLITKKHVLTAAHCFNDYITGNSEKNRKSNKVTKKQVKGDQSQKFYAS